MNREILAYLAGAMDSDGYFTIKKSTYHKRVIRDCFNATYSEKIGLKQVTPTVPELLKKTFGGTVHFAKSKHTNRKSTFAFIATDVTAYDACEALKPFLRIKIQQCQCLLELRKAKDGKYRKLAYWFELENPNWRNYDLISMDEASVKLNYTHPLGIYQAIRNGSIPSISNRLGSKKIPTIPAKFVDLVINERGEIRGTQGGPCPSQLLQWKESLFCKIKELNMLGIYGTSVNHLTGYHTPK